MTTYTLERRAPACAVTRDLIQELEDCILAAAKPLVGENFDPELNFHVEIKDRLGTEQLASIRAYPSPSFPNGTESVRISYLDYARVQIAITFSLSREFSSIALTIKGDQSRERALGVEAEIRALLANHKTWNGFFSPNLWVLIPLIGLTLFAITWTFTLLVAFGRLPTSSWGWGLAVGTGPLASYWLLKYLLPYTTFDSRQARARRDLARWLLLGILGFILFTVAGVFLRRRFLGY